MNTGAVLKNVANKMNHVASDTACAYSPGSTVARKIARGRQIDGGERVGQKGKGRNERKRETNWKSPEKRNELAGATSEAIGEQ